MTNPIQHLNDKVKPANAKFVVRLDPEKGYAVWSPEGVRVTEHFWRDPPATTRMKQMQALADKAAKKTARPCLCCGQSFESEGIHNRMCNGCRGRAGSIDSPASIGRISGIRRSA